MGETRPKEMYVWIDLETTGLDEDVDQPLELSFLATDENLTTLSDTVESYLLRCTGGLKLSEYTFAMHSKSGLVRDLAENLDRLSSVEVVDAALSTRVVFLLARASMRGGGDYVPVLAGSTPHFDRKFIRRYFPKLDGVLHYRHFDVSTLKAAFRSWLPEFEVAEDDAAHRAGADILESLAHARRFRRFFQDLRVATAPPTIDARSSSPLDLLRKVSGDLDEVLRDADADKLLRYM